MEKINTPLMKKTIYPLTKKLREDEENKNNLPCYPVGIAFACFLQIEKEYGG